MPLEATIGQLFAPYCPGGRHGQQFRRKKSGCGVVKSLYEASIKKARNGPSPLSLRGSSPAFLAKKNIKF